VDVLRIAGFFHGEISRKGDASKVLVVVVLVLGLSGRKWWMAGGGGGDERVREGVGDGE